MDNKPLVSEEGTPFNMAMMYYMRIDQNMAQLSSALVRNDLLVAYDLLEELFTKVDFKLKENERGSVNGKLQKIRTKLFLSKKDREYAVNHVSKIKSLMQEVDRDIRRLMDKYKMIFPKIDMGAGYNKMKDRYGLEGVK